MNVEKLEEITFSSVVNTLTASMIITSVGFGLWMKDITAGLFMFGLITFILSSCVYLKKYI
jgi:uncharacterized membrane protein YhhN